MSDLQTSFEKAKDDVTQLPSAPDNTTKLKLYGLFKQSTEGDVCGEKPGMFDFVGGAKYEAWNALKGTSKEQAQQQYVALVEELKAKA